MQISYLIQLFKWFFGISYFTVIYIILPFPAACIHFCITMKISHFETKHCWALILYPLWLKLIYKYFTSIQAYNFVVLFLLDLKKNCCLILLYCCCHPHWICCWHLKTDRFPHNNYCFSKPFLLLFGTLVFCTTCSN